MRRGFFFASSEDTAGDFRHLYCPRHLSTGPVCGQPDNSASVSQSAPRCPDCEAQNGICPYCALPDELTTTPIGRRVIR